MDDGFERHMEIAKVGALIFGSLYLGRALVGSNIGLSVLMERAAWGALAVSVIAMAGVECWHQTRRRR